jgi:hypothetical protein
VCVCVCRNNNYCYTEAENNHFNIAYVGYRASTTGNNVFDVELSMTLQQCQKECVILPFCEALSHNAIS